MTRRSRPLAHLFVLAAAALWGSTVLASEAGPEMPWNGPLDLLRANFTGPTATAVILIAIAVGLMVWSFGDDNRGLWKAFKGILTVGVVAALATGALLGNLGISASLL